MPTIVHDRSGAHVAGLKKEDFKIEENGAEQKIAVWEEVRTTTSAARTTVAAKPNSFTNAAPVSDRPLRVTIVALDFINTPIADQGRARAETVKFLASWASSGEPLMLVALTRSGVHMIHDYTEEPLVLALALNKARIQAEDAAGPASLEQRRSETESDPTMQALLQAAEEADKSFDAWQQEVAIRQTLDGLQQIARALAGVPGRKSLLWASAGFPFTVTDSFMSLNPNIASRAGILDIDEQYRRTWRLLNSAQIAVYPVDVGGLINPTNLSAAMTAPTQAAADPSSMAGGPRSPNGRPSRNPGAFAQLATFNQNDRFSTFQEVAAATGGRAFLNTSDVAGAMRRAVEDSSEYYLLGYYRNARDTKPGWRRLSVKVNHPGAEVRARDGFFVEKPDRSEKEAKREVTEAMVSPLDATGLTFEVRWIPGKNGAKTKQVSYELNVPFEMLYVDEGDDNHITLQWELAAKKQTGEVAKSDGQTIDAHLKPESVAKLREGGLHFDNTLQLPPGDYKVRFLVRDVLAGRMGTVTAPLKVE